MKRCAGLVSAWLGGAGLRFSLGMEITTVTHRGPRMGSDRAPGKFVSISSPPTWRATATQLHRSRSNLSLLRGRS
jgi:hypothetical protein